MENIIEYEKEFAGFTYSVQTYEPVINPKNIMIIYVHGLYSTMRSYKAEALLNAAKQHQMGFCRYELLGHDKFFTNYDQTDMDMWVSQLNEVIQDFVTRKIILIGSCFGGLVGLRAAQMNPQRIFGMISIGTVDIDWRNLLDEKQNLELKTQGYTYRFLFEKLNPCRISEKYVVSTEKNCISGKYCIDFPIHIFYGTEDELVDFTNIKNLCRQIEAPNKIVKLVSGANHRMSDSASIEEMKNSLLSFKEKVPF